MAQQKGSNRIFRSMKILVILFALPMMSAGCARGSPEAMDPITATNATGSEKIIPTSSVSTEQLAYAATVGDIAAGEELFHQPVEGVPHEWSCSTCHSLDGSNSQDGPTLTGISELAGVRVNGLSDVEYLRQSIVDPYAYRLEGEWRGAMPYQYSELLTQDQINNLIAFLLTR